MGWSFPYIPPCSGSLPLSWQQVYCPLMEIQYESGAGSGVSSLSFTMLLRVYLSSLSLSISPPLAGGNMVESSSWVLTLRLCQSSRLLGFWILETWQSSLTLADFLTLAGVLGSSCLLQFLVLVSLPDFCWSSGLFWPS